MKSARRRLDVNLEELDRVLDEARAAPLSEADHDKLKDALHAMAAMLARSRNTEKTSAVVEPTQDEPAEESAPPATGHGQNGAAAFTGAGKVRRYSLPFRREISRIFRSYARPLFART